MGDCDVPGNEAFYGIGIRIGFYLQYLVFIWAGTWLFFKHNLAERAGAALALWLFKFGTVVALLADVIGAKTLKPVEVYVILLLLLRIPILRLVALFFDIAFSVPQPRMSKDDVSDSLASLALLTIDVGLSLWFWTTGVYTGESSTDCPQVGFLFAKVDLTAPWFAKVNIVCLVIFYLEALCLGVIRVIDSRRKKKQSKRDDRTGHSGAKCYISSMYYTFESFVAIAGIECTIRWNNIADVNNLKSTAQIVPFVIGVGVMVRALRPFRRIWESIGAYKPDKTVPERQECHNLPHYNRQSWNRPAQQVPQRVEHVAEEWILKRAFRKCFEFLR